MAQHKIKTPAELRRSTLTQFTTTVNGFDIYSHRIKPMLGSYVILWNDTDWSTYNTRADAEAAATRGRI